MHNIVLVERLSKKNRLLLIKAPKLGTIFTLFHTRYGAINVTDDSMFKEPDIENVLVKSYKCSTVNYTETLNLQKRRRWSYP